MGVAGGAYKGDEGKCVSPFSRIEQMIQDSKDRKSKLRKLAEGIAYIPKAKKKIDRVIKRVNKRRRRGFFRKIGRALEKSFIVVRETARVAIRVKYGIPI